MQCGVEVVPVPVDERLAPHVPAELPVGRGGAGLAVLAGLAVDCGAAQLDVDQTVAHARRDHARLEQGREQHGVLSAVTAARARLIRVEVRASGLGSQAWVPGLGSQDEGWGWGWVKVRAVSEAEA